EDIFGLAGQKASAGSRFGPSGTVVMPAQHGFAKTGGGLGKPVAVGLAALVFLVGTISVVGFMRHKARQRWAVTYVEPSTEPEATLAVSTSFNYGPVLERVLEFSNPNRRALNLAAGNYVGSTPDHPLSFEPGEANSLRGAGVDLYLSNATIARLTNKPAIGDALVDALDCRGPSD